VLWVIRPPAPKQLAIKGPLDPFASRRPAQDAGASAPVRSDGDRSERAFLDASGAGHEAYAGGDYAAALAHYQAAVERNQDDAESWSNMGQVLVRLNRVKEAIPCFQRALALIPERWAYQFNLAHAQGLLGDWEQSVTAYRRAQELFPDDYVTTFNLALALHRKGDEAAAATEYRKAIFLQPEDASFRLALATSLERLQKPKEAAEAYAEYLRLSPTAEDADKVRARITQLSGAGS
jgi:Flp pilus assembly protein TadD